MGRIWDAQRTSSGVPGVPSGSNWGQLRERRQERNNYIYMYIYIVIYIYMYDPGVRRQRVVFLIRSLLKNHGGDSL